MSKKVDLLSVTQAAREFGYTRAWIQKLLIKGMLKGEKNSAGHWRVGRAAMKDLARKRQEREGGPEAA